MAAGNNSALLHWQCLSIGCGLELLDEVAICGPCWRRILAHHLCADDQGASGQRWRETSSEPEAHQRLWRKATDQETSTLSRACTPDSGLHGHMLSRR
jgi:hypothetical protein